MTLISSGTLYAHGDGSEQDGLGNQSVVYEVWKYIPTSDYDWTDVFADAKNSSGVSEGFNDLSDFAGWSRHNSMLWVKLTNMNFNIEVHVSDHTDPPISGDQFGSTVTDNSEAQVGELWGDGTPSGGDNDIDFTKPSDTAIVGGDNVEIRSRSRSRYSGSWGSFSSWTSYTSGGTSYNMRDNDYYFELRRTWGRVFVHAINTTVDYNVDLDGTHFPLTTLDTSITNKGTRQDANDTFVLQDSGGSNFTDLDLVVKIYRRTKNTSGSWGSAIQTFLGWNSTDSYSGLNFSSYDYLFEVDDQS